MPKLLFCHACHSTLATSFFSNRQKGKSQRRCKTCITNNIQISSGNNINKKNTKQKWRQKHRVYPKNVVDKDDDHDKENTSIVANLNDNSINSNSMDDKQSNDDESEDHWWETFDDITNHYIYPSCHDSDYDYDIPQSYLNVKSQELIDTWQDADIIKYTLLDWLCNDLILLIGEYTLGVALECDDENCENRLDDGLILFKNIQDNKSVHIDVRHTFDYINDKIGWRCWYCSSEYCCQSCGNFFEKDQLTTRGHRCQECAKNSWKETIAMMEYDRWEAEQIIKQNYRDMMHGCGIFYW